jgi:hypothetical protein
VTHESPAQGRASADARDVDDKSTETGGQGADVLTAKQRTRISGVTIEGKLAVRGPGYEPFDFATTIGKGMAPGGTFRTLLPGEVAICVVVKPSHRDKVLELTGITARAWRSYVSKWQDDRMAHRCAELGRGAVSLFYHPHAVCPVPACREALPPERKQRTADAAAAFPISGSSMPRNVLKTGDASRDEEGDARPLSLEVKAAVEERSEALERGFSEIASRIGRERDLGLADRDIAALLNNRSIPPPEGFRGWTGHAVRTVIEAVTDAA